MLTIPHLASTSPTLAETMRACFLSAGLSRAPGSRSYVLGNPKAWLGTAYHEVMEALPTLASGGIESPILQRAEMLWSQAITRLEQEAASHPINHRFGSAVTWRGYYLVLETLRIRVAELAGAVGPRSDQQAAGRGEELTFVLREEEFNAHSGKLRGRIDLVRGDEIIDYKTGALFEADTGDEPPALKAAYVRQLRIYAFLVHEATGHWPRRGLLYPLAGPPVAVDLEPAACETEATEAITLLERYNDAVARGGDTNNLATPSPEACRWCPFKTMCPPFWTNVEESWAGVLDGQAVSGRLNKPPQVVHAGAAWSIGLMADAGTVAPGEIVISPLSAAVHPTVSQLCQGDRVRIVGLGRRNNGSLFPTQRTVVVRDTDTPTMQLGAQPQSG